MKEDIFRILALFGDYPKGTLRGQLRWRIRDRDSDYRRSRPERINRVTLDR